jgi:hypothetical protein
MTHISDGSAGLITKSIHIEDTHFVVHAVSYHLPSNYAH